MTLKKNRAYGKSKKLLHQLAKKDHGGKKGQGRARRRAVKKGETWP